MSRFKGYPRTVKSLSTNGNQEWTIVDELYARRDLPSERRLANEVQRVDQSTSIFQTCNDVAMSEETEESQTPVYRSGKDGPVGVPTGLIFIRFGTDTPLQSRRDQLKELGYEIAKGAAVTEGGWVRHNSGFCEASLSNSAKLHEIDGVCVVEPQFLMSRQSKSSRGPMQRR